MTIEQFLARLDGVRPTGEGRWSARCPGHEDRSPSLSIAEGEDGRILVFCHAGCSFRRIAEALNLRPADFFADSLRPRVRREAARERREAMVTEAVRAAMREAEGRLAGLYRETVTKLESGGWEQIMDNAPTAEPLARLADRLSYWEWILDRCLEGEFSAFVEAAVEVAKYGKA